jgi:hypothetical protein
MPKPPFLRVTWAAIGAAPHPGGPAARPANISLEAERREVLDSVLDALASNPPDPDEMAACRHLLKRLAETAGRHRRHGRDSA